MHAIIIGLVTLTSISLIPSTTTYVREEIKIENKVEVVRAEVSAYTSSIDETNEDPFTTASGSTTRDGIVACPSRLEFGTKVEINGIEYTCEDRMNRRYRDKENYDIWVSEKEIAYEWGRQQLKIKIYRD